MAAPHEYVRFITFMAVCIACAAAQSTITGEVSGQGLQAGSLSVELVSGDQIVQHTPVAPDGRFEFAGVVTGAYEVRITDPFATVVQSRSVSVPGDASGVKFKLNGSEATRPAAETISVHRLMQRVPSAARREFERGGEAALKGQYEKAIGHFRKALAVFPDYEEAHNDLGVCYLENGAFRQAAAEFLAAIKADSHAVRPISNLAVAWLGLGRFRDAEFAARRAVILDPGADFAQRALHLALARVIVTADPPR